MTEAFVSEECMSFTIRPGKRIHRSSHRPKTAGRSLLDRTIVGGVRLEAGKLVVDNGDPGDCASSDLAHPEFWDRFG